MKRKIFFFAFALSFSLSSIFYILTSLDDYNRGMSLHNFEEKKIIEYIQLNQEQEQIVDPLAVMKDLHHIDNFYHFDKNGDFIYPEDEDADGKIIQKNISNLLKYEETFFPLYLPDLHSNYGFLIRDNRGASIIGIMTQPTLSASFQENIGSFILALVIGTIFSYILFVEVYNRQKRDIQDLIRSFREYVSDPKNYIKRRENPIYSDYAIKDEKEKLRFYIDAIQLQLNALSDMIVNMNEGVLLVGMDRKIMTINKAAIRLLEGSIETNYKGQDLYYLTRHEVFTQSFLKNLKLGERSTDKVVVKGKTIKLYYNPVQNENHEFYGMMLLMIDETELAQAERQRREFTSNVSHELKTPLTSIKGYTELLLGGGIPDEDAKHFYEVILDESNRLFELIDGLISISKIEESTKKDKHEVVDIYQLVEGIIESQKSDIQERNLSTKVHPGKNNKIITHPRAIEQILWNLINNAILYNKMDGEIEIFINDLGEMIEIKISDTGIGIPYEDQNRIFERFYMVDKSRSYNKKSTGLGLSIVKHNVTFLNGDISVESTPRRGTKFTLTFPKNF